MMLKAGWVDEIRDALKKKITEQAPAMTSIGYRELLRYVHGDLSLADAVALTKQAVRRYAKRQLTWFMKDKRIRWAKDEDEAVEMVGAWLGERR
jgi:tRNA dimethylallyltransferase